uniref:Zinc finger CCHC domain-containing protein 8 n=1 Tax=Stegastes partitus TaxID=144197 RepID=A0A3B5BD58_9TELE
LSPSSEAAVFAWLQGRALWLVPQQVASHFGDSELFQQLDDSAPPLPTHIRFTDDEGDQEETSQLRSRLEECDDYIQKLTEENILLSVELTVLLALYGITVEDVNIDGPLLQILYSNNTISNVLYFTTFSVDKLGQPLVNENPQLTDGWDVPTYHQVFNQVIGTDGQEIEMKDKRPKSMCFNCGSSAHQMRDCPKPKDMAAINERRKEFNQNSNQAMQSNQRYHADEVEERFAKYKPGVMSEELLSALGIDGNTLPPLIYRMRQLGYPPGWLKEAEMENSGLSLYDGNDSSTSQNISYDVSKLVDFPGFNVSASHKMKDYGSIPMQSSHMKQNYAAYLSNNFPMPGATCNKRRHDADSSPQQRKKTRSSPDRHSDRSSDMDIESGSCSSMLPCSSGSPPPLPQGTPPATPTPPPLPKGTPPPTPTNGSPALRGRNWAGVDETAEGAEDDLTLEELEEQQRLIWAALENADTATNSDCDTPAVGTPAHVDTEPEEAEEAMDTMKSAEPCQSNETQKEPSVQETFSESPGPIKVEDDSPQSPEPVKATDDNPQSPPPVKSHDDSPQSPDPVRCLEDNPQSPNADFPNPEAGDASPKNVEKITAVPDRSKFAAGIVPFEDTPEFTEVAEATGTYLRIRDLLKSSPRSLAKKK